MDNKISRIINSFSPLITYTNVILSNASEFNFEEVKSNYNSLITKSNNELKKYKFDEKSINKILLAYISWIDEKILSSEINFKSMWRKYSLQKEHFNTSTLGNEFFVQYDNIDDGYEEVKLVYTYILSLGFKGRYLFNEDELNSLIKKDLDKYNYELDESYFKNVIHKTNKLKMPKRKLFYFKVNYLLITLLISVVIVLSMNYFLNQEINNINNKFENIK
jgi:type IV/VI secretion system ImpK/VasF family protein